MKWLFLVLLLQGGTPERQALLEQRLQAILATLEQLTREVESIRSELRQTSVTPTDTLVDSDAFKARVIDVTRNVGERDDEFFTRPTIFLSTRYAAAHVESVSTNEGFTPNFSLNRLEFNMEGRLNGRFGMGFEIQYHPAVKGSPEELVNLAYLDSYLNDHTTLRAGQFVVPFGFDLQQSSFDREYPERLNAAGYFFPGQRDRGVMLMGNTNFANSRWLRNWSYNFAVTNGNNFFDDNNANPSVLARVRRSLHDGFTIGASTAIGQQPLPRHLGGGTGGNRYGADVQLVWRRLGIRTELMAGDMPTTLLSTPDEQHFAAEFALGRQLVGFQGTALLKLSNNDIVYGRYDQLNPDIVKGWRIRATDIGWTRYLSENVHFIVDYQWKNRPSFNDDFQNQRFSISLKSEFN